MADWTLFLERGKKDLDISQRIFQNHNDYEMGAYMCQQALEKHIKAYLIESKIVDNPLDLGHFQIPFVISIIAKKLNAMKRNTSQSNPFHLVIDHMINMVDHLRKLFDSIKNDDEKLVHWWQYSLKMTQKIEDKNYEDFVKSMSRTGGRLLQSFGNYNEIKLSPNIDKLGKISKQLQSEFRWLADNMTKASTQLKNKEMIQQTKTKESSLKELELLKKVIQLQKQGKLKGNLSTVDLEKSMILYDVLARYIDLIMLTYPHAIIGRYPRMIEEKGISSTMLYKDHKDNVWDLISQVKISCNEIENKIHLVIE